METKDSFVEWFRSSAPYIHAHRGRTFVIVFGGELLKSEALKSFAHDVALLQSLGIRIVLVAGARPQIDERIVRGGKKAVFHKGLRVTDDFAMSCVKEAAGTNRVELEAVLSMGLPNSPMAGARIRVATGNFVTARPVGVIEGVDYQHTGEVRRVDAEAMKSLLDDGFVAVLTSIGYSMTGDAFNTSTPDVAAAAAIALKADKLVCLYEGKPLADAQGAGIHELTPAGAEGLLAKKSGLTNDQRRYVESAIRACRHGVRRAHLVPRKLDGGLLRELFSRDGIGTLVTGEIFEGVRPGSSADVPGLLELLEPLEAEGILVRRPREMLERDIHRFIVIERDGMIVGCCALIPYPDEGIAELAAVAVHPTYRHHGRADQLLQYVEKQCRDQGLRRVFVLTTQTSHWFQERGFVPASVKALPADKRSKYDPQRRSKVLVKQL